MFKPTKNPQIEELLKSCHERRLNTSDLPREKKKCVWCMADLEGRKYMWCSPECGNSAWAHVNPQKEGGLQLLLVRQGWKCAGCQHDYVPYRDKAIAYMNGSRYYKDSRVQSSEADTVYSFHLMKILKSNCPRDRSPEVDHISPIYKGGQSLGFDNHQAICYTCHKAKSKIDNSGPRKKSKCPTGSSDAG